jgi:uncharacterized membrane protein
MPRSGWRTVLACPGLWGLLLALGGCGSGPGTSSCPNQTSPSCPTPAPSYAGEVSAIIASQCAVCHAPGGMEATMPLTTDAQIQSRAGAMLGQVFNCLMPPAGAAPLDDAQRQALLGWLACGAPMN